MDRKATAQEDTMGCGIACVAFVLGIDYKKVKSFFDRHDGTRPDCYCPDIVRALKRGGLAYRWRKIRGGERVRYRTGSMVFVEANEKLPAGHYLVRTRYQIRDRILKTGNRMPAAVCWMDPWINLDIRAPDIRNSKAGYRTRLPGKAAYYIFPADSLNDK